MNLLTDCQHRIAARLSGELCIDLLRRTRGHDLKGFGTKI
jgi:hypothetical protein